MASTISDLKMAATDPDIRVSDLLRRALVIAGELDLDEFREWIHKELNGYTEEEIHAGKLPQYRMLRALVQAFNPYHGWRPILFDKGPEMGEKLSRMPIPFAINRIEDHGTDDLAFTFVEPTESQLRNSLPFPAEIRRYVDGASYRGVVDAVRNQILEWAMRLEDVGVTGDGNTFTQEEKVSAKSTPSFHFENVGNVTVIGDVSGQARVAVKQDAPFSSEQHGTLLRLLDEIDRFKDQLGVRDAQLAELNAHLWEIREETATAKPDAGKVRRAVASIIKIAEGAAGGLIASGIATQLSRFL